MVDRLISFFALMGLIGIGIGASLSWQGWAGATSLAVSYALYRWDISPRVDLPLSPPSTKE